MKRRNFLLGSGALALGFHAQRLGAGAREGRLKMPRLLDATKSGSFELTAQSGQTNFTGSASSDTWGFNQPFLGPTIRMKSMGEVQAKVSNSLREDISVHWHGLVVPGSVDGGPHQPVPAGEDWRPVLPMDQPACTAWYHSHLHGQTAAQVQRGLAGVLHLDDGLDGDRELPVRYGIDDLTLILQDRRFDQGGRMTYAPGMRDSMMGFLGNRMLVNGQIDRVAVVPRGMVRLRLLNACNARILALSMSDGRPIHQIATDSGLLSRPQTQQVLPLSPSERAEVLVDFSDGNDVTLVSAAVENTPMMGNGMMGRRAPSNGFEVLRFSVDETVQPGVTALPDDLGGALASIDEEPAVRRRLSLDMKMGMGMMRLFGGDRFSINGRAFAMDYMNIEASLGAVEEWTVSGAMMMHPFHVHGTMFQVISENGGPPQPHNLGWKDTILIDGEAVIRMRFEQKASRDLPYMFHCHILEHEDGGMMGQFTVT